MYEVDMVLKKSISRTFRLHGIVLSAGHLGWLVTSRSKYWENASWWSVLSSPASKKTCLSPFYSTRRQPYVHGRGEISATKLHT